MAKSKLIALGCSYTEHYLHSMHAMGVDHSFTRWPQLLADKLDMECVNLGRSGFGNEFMVSKLLDVLHTEKNIGLVVIMWSEWQRMDFQIESYAWRPLHPHRDNEAIEMFPMNKEGRKTLLKYYNVVAATMKNLRQFVMVQELCRDVPYLMIQGCCPITDPLYIRPEHADIDTEPLRFVDNMKEVRRIRKIATKQIIDCPLEIDENKFIGWPIFSEIDGYDVDTMLDKLDRKRKKYRVSDNDSHPNGPGHEVISEEIYKVYKEVYE